MFQPLTSRMVFRGTGAIRLTLCNIISGPLKTTVDVNVQNNEEIINIQLCQNRFIPDYMYFQHVAVLSGCKVTIVSYILQVCTLLISVYNTFI